MQSKAQGTVEYLVLVAVIVVIGLFVVYFSMNLFDSTSVSGTNTKISSKIGSGSISVLEAVADDESLLVVLSSLDPSGVELTKVSVDGVENDYENVFFADARGFVLNELSQNCTCSSGQTSRTCSFQFSYITKNGSNQTTNPVNVVVDCVSSVETSGTNYILTQDTNSPTITLLTPTNNETIMENEVNFIFQVSDDRNVSSCSLFVGGVDVNTITNNFSSITTTISTDGFYDWNISCTDSSNNIGNSSTYDLEVDASDYEINNCLELQEMQNDLSGDYTLVANIDCSDITDFSTIYNFSGTLDGDNKTIINFSALGGNGGLFGSLLVGSIVSNLTIENAYVTEDVIGIIAEYNSGSISNVHVEGQIICNLMDCGGIVANNGYSGTIELSSANIYSENLSDNSGGLVGNNYGSITTSYAIVDLLGSRFLGGLVGNNYGTISKSYSIGVINSGFDMGGLVNHNSGTITDCYSYVNVYPTQLYAGGLAGSNDGTIVNSYSTGLVDSFWPIPSSFGGLVGKTSTGTVTSSYWDLNTSEILTSNGGTGKTTIEMMQQSTFENWDFDTIWEIDEGNSYPTLQWQSN